MRRFSKVEKIIFCTIAGVLDFLLNAFFNHYLNMPVFLDTTFVVTALLLFDFPCSVYTLLVFYVLKSFFPHMHQLYTLYEFFYSLGGLAYIGICALFFKKKEDLFSSVYKTFWIIFEAALLGAIATSVVGGIINTIYFGKMSDSYIPRRLFFIFFGHNVNLLLSCILGRIPIFVLDRLITTFLGFALFKFFNKIFEERQN